MTNKSKNKFFWGASTASHQVEGGTYNQWTVWELANAKQLAKTAKRRLKWMPNYDKISKYAEDPNNYVSGKGVDHYNRYKEDFDILHDLNLNAFRFTIEWSRIEPEEGVFDAKEIEHYRQYIGELKKRGIEPFLNIWHWTMPVWFTDKGGFEKRGNIKYFTRYVEKLAEELLGDIKYVIILNEPNTYVGMSYGLAAWPPQSKNPYILAKVFYNLTTAHKRAYKIIKQHNADINVGAAYHLFNPKPYRKNHVIDRMSAYLVDYASDWWWLDRVKKYQDFVGFNYYFTDYYRGFAKHNPKEPLNDMGWYMEPRGVLEIMRKISKRYRGKPIIITENGVADKKDQYRKWWLQETMNAIDEAKNEEIPIVGYLHWSLLDNSEWDSGWWPKFGLVEVDRSNNMKRTIRPSAKWWASELKKRQRLQIED